MHTGTRLIIGGIAIAAIAVAALTANHGEAPDASKAHRELCIQTAESAAALLSRADLKDDQFAQLSKAIAAALGQPDAQLMVIDRQGIILKGANGVSGKRVSRMYESLNVDDLYLDFGESRVITGAGSDLHAIGLGRGATVVLAASPPAPRQNSNSSRGLLLVALVATLILLLGSLKGTGSGANLEPLRTAASRILQGKVVSPVTDKPAGTEVIVDAFNLLNERAQQNEELEEQLLRSQKMEVVGTLASGIAHDFNNVLGGISGALDLIRSEITTPDVMPDTHIISSMARVAVDCVQRGRETVDRLLSFSRKNQQRKECVDVNVVIPSVRKMCVHTFDTRIEIIAETVEEDALICGHRSDLEQALLNVCFNARDAMDGCGKLILRVAVQDADELRTRTSHQLTARRYVIILVRDDGSGMNSETMARIFQPFFTTKAKGKGTGLGLANAYRIIEDSGGWIDVQSKIGEGTSVFFYLPAESVAKDQAMLVGSFPDPVPIPDEQTQLGTPAPAPDTQPGSKQTILIIEDDGILRELTASHLETLGFNVISTTTGEEALTAFDDNIGSIDGILLDLILPGISGEDVFKKIHKDSPETRFLVTSGSNNDDLITEMIINGCKGFLPKPYSLDELSASVTNVLLANGR